MSKAKVLGICVGVSLLLLCGVLAGAALSGGKLKKNVTIEAGNGELSASDFLRGEVQGMNIKPLTDLAEIDLHIPGDYVVQFLVNGKTQTSLLKIRDTLPPTAVVKKEVSICVGDSVSVYDFVSDIEDGTEVTAEFTVFEDGAEVLNPGDIVGEHEVNITLTDSVSNRTEYTSTLAVCNIKKTVTHEIGSGDVNPAEFKKDNADKVQFESDDEDMPDTLGTHAVKLLWNGTPVEAILKIVDTTPPQINVDGSLEFFLGDTVLYRKNVTVTDNSGSEIELKINNDAVNTQETGEYEVIYSATDPSGNTSQLTVPLIIKEPPTEKMEQVSAYALSVLKELGISATDEITREDYQTIFRWLRTNITYSGISDKSSSVNAALAGFETREGDCFTYSSVAAALFDRLGIVNMIITRDSDSFHSWNLVSFEDKWYHFDACPYLPGETFEACLVGDAELSAFSESYGRKHPDGAHKDFYKFRKEDYPERAE